MRSRSWGRTSPNFANLVQTNQVVHNAEHVLFLVVGYLFFLPILGQ